MRNQKAMLNTWCPRPDLNRHALRQRFLRPPRLPIPSLGQIKTHFLVPKTAASRGSSCRTNSRAVFLNPQDWGVPTPTTSVSTALRKGVDNRTEIFFPFKERKIISTKFLHYLSHLINIMSNLIFSSGDKWFVPYGVRTHNCVRLAVFLN